MSFVCRWQSLFLVFGQSLMKAMNSLWFVVDYKVIFDYYAMLSQVQRQFLGKFKHKNEHYSSNKRKKLFGNGRDEFIWKWSAIATTSLTFRIHWHLKKKKLRSNNLSNYYHLNGKKNVNLTCRAGGKYCSQDHNWR